jgi:hypothetical protein
MMINYLFLMDKIYKEALDESFKSNPEFKKFNEQEIEDLNL